MRELKTVLVYAGISGIGFNSYGRGLENSWVSHGLCSVSAAIKAGGYRVELLDLRQLKGWDEFSLLIRDKEPAVVGLTMMSVDFNPVIRCAELIKKINRNIIVAIGGIHPTVAADEFLDKEAIDYVVIGEGELSFLELLKNLESRKTMPKIIKGEKPDLEKLPFEDRELFPYPELPLPGLFEPFCTIIIGRGCKFSCNFCQPAERILFGSKVRRRSVLNVISELQMLKSKIKFKSFLIHDDCFVEDPAWVSEFCLQYSNKGFKESFACQGRADLIVRHKELLGDMAQAGLKLIFIGFESGSQRVLDFLKKGTTVEQNMEAARICKRYGIKIWANYMFGIPTETKDEVLATVKMIKKIKPDFYSPAFFTPFPGSQLFEYCRSQDLLLFSNHDSYRRNPSEPKIKGIDYDFLKIATQESQRRSFWSFLINNRN